MPSWLRVTELRRGPKWVAVTAVAGRAAIVATGVTAMATNMVGLLGVTAMATIVVVATRVTGMATNVMVATGVTAMATNVVGANGGHSDGHQRGGG